MTVVIPRAPWPTYFPDVVIHGDLPARNRHPNLAIAKAGNAAAALSLVRDLLSDIALDQLRAMLKGRQPFLVPVTAIEVAGFNAIPDAMAQEIGSRVGLRPLAGPILQSNKVAHTRADGWHRLVTPATFTGAVDTTAEYLLVDDHVGFGGTFANLRGHIEQAGGRVLGMTALTETGGAGRSLFLLQCFPCYNHHMEKTSNNSGANTSVTASTASPNSREDIYVVSNPLTPSELVWLRQQSEHVATVFRQSQSEPSSQPG